MRYRYYTDDPVADFERYDAEREGAMALLPSCSCCGKQIQEEHCYEIDGIICENCLIEYFRKDTTDFM